MAIKFGEFIESSNDVRLKIDLIIPCFNEAKRISIVADSLINLLKSQEIGVDLSLIFVDDGSTDDTAELIENRLNHQSLNASLIKLDKNRGVGCAFLRALDFSNSDLVCLYPGDGVFDINSLIVLINSSQCDCITLSTRTNRHHAHTTRRYFSKLFGIWFSWLSNNYVPDPHSLFLIPTSTAKLVIKELWGDLPLQTGFRLENDYHVRFLHEVLTKQPVTNLVGIQVVSRFEKNTSVWNFPFILRFCRICVRMTLNKFKFFKKTMEA
jgi:glycosyltransferase involved in cell wall biosynthesis